MVQIVVTPDQAQAIADAKDGIEFVDAHGNRLGFFARAVSEAELETARQRFLSDEPRHSTQQVLERLESLEN